MSTTYKNFNLYSQDKLKYKPKPLLMRSSLPKADCLQIKTVLTTRYLNKIFNYPSYNMKLTRDSTAQSLIAKVYLTPRKKYSFGTTLDVTHSNIQDFGVGFSVSETIRNVFNGAETLELAARGNIGSSKI
jgi:hypothetical protein